MNKHRMNKNLSDFAARLRGRISSSVAAEGTRLKLFESDAGLLGQSKSEPPHVGCYEVFDSLALELFALQFKNNPAYRNICQARGATPETVEHWTRIPAVPASAFKELELSCIPSQARTAVFHSSGTTEQKPSRHFHSAESLAIYEASLWTWFKQNVFANSEFRIQNSELLVLTPPPEQAQHSSLVHMFETVRRKLGAEESVFVGKLDADNSWTLDFDAVFAALDDNSKLKTQNSKTSSGHRFLLRSFVGFLLERNLRFGLPAGSRVMETGGYKNRSRSMPKSELHALITERLGIPPENIICEYGMSELSSQAYDQESQKSEVRSQKISVSSVGARANHFAGNRTRSGRGRNRLDPHSRSGECLFRCRRPDGGFGNPPRRWI